MDVPRRNILAVKISCSPRLLRPQFHAGRSSAWKWQKSSKPDSQTSPRSRLPAFCRHAMQTALGLTFPSYLPEIRGSSKMPEDSGAELASAACRAALGSGVGALKHQGGWGLATSMSTTRHGNEKTPLSFGIDLVTSRCQFCVPASDTTATGQL